MSEETYTESVMLAEMRRADEYRQERDRAILALQRIRTIGARSGTNINAWNEAFDVLEELGL